MRDTLTATCYLVVEARKGRSYPNVAPSLHVARVAARKPSTRADQVAIRLELALPRGLFERPALTARIQMDGEAAPLEITAETAAAVEDAIRAGGFDVRVMPARTEGDQP